MKKNIFMLVINLFPILGICQNRLVNEPKELILLENGTMIDEKGNYISGGFIPGNFLEQNVIKGNCNLLFERLGIDKPVMYDKKTLEIISDKIDMHKLEKSLHMTKYFLPLLAYTVEYIKHQTKCQIGINIITLRDDPGQGYPNIYVRSIIARFQNGQIFSISNVLKKWFSRYFRDSFEKAILFILDQQTIKKGIEIAPSWLGTPPKISFLKKITLAINKWFK